MCCSTTKDQGPLVLECLLHLKGEGCTREAQHCTSAHSNVCMEEQEGWSSMYNREEALIDRTVIKGSLSKATDILSIAKSQKLS